MTRFASVVLDVDSTLSQIEGIEWLAGRCDETVRAHIVETTNAAMRGDIDLETVYGERLSLVRPTRRDIEALSRAYIDAISPGAKEAVATLRDAGVRVVIVSGGILEAILPLAASIGVPPEDTHAVSLRFDVAGHYLDYDHESPVARRGGKPRLVETFALPRPTLALGDGITDAELKPVVNMFVAFIGVVRHEHVLQMADCAITRFDDLLPLVL